MGPLKGLRIVEMAGIGPAPFCAMLLSDMGAEIIRVDRREKTDLGLPGKEPKFDVLHRGRRSVSVDVKSEAGRDVVRRLATKADALIEGFRPGVMERLGLGPETLLAANPKLVFGRMTGFGQEGPMAPRAGHDINYIALAGALHTIGRKGEAPMPPLRPDRRLRRWGMLLAFGVVCALLEARISGKGQVVDAAMVDGSALLMSAIYGFYAQGTWKDERGVNILDTGAPYYNVYETKDGKWVSIGSIEQRFYDDLLGRLGVAGRICRSSMSKPAGRSSRAGLPRCSRPRPGRNGKRCSLAAMRALRQCCLCQRWQLIRTMPSVRRLSRATA